MKKKDAVVLFSTWKTCTPLIGSRHVKSGLN